MDSTPGMCLNGRMFRALFLLVTVLVTPAAAGWDVKRSVDPLTNKTTAFATATETSGKAALRVSCMNGRPFISVAFATPFSFYPVDASYRFDAGSVETQRFYVSRSGKDVWPWLATEPIGRLKRTKRLRMWLFTPGRDPTFLDFDTADGAAAIEQVKCR